MMPVGLGTRKCHRSPLRQEGSNAHYGLPEGRFPMKPGMCSPLLTPSVLGAEVRGCQAAWWRSSWYILYSNTTWLQEAEPGGAQTGLCSPALSLGPVQGTAAPAQLGLPPSAPGNRSLTMGETGRDWQFEEHWASSMLSAWGKHVQDTPVAFYEFKSSLVVVPCLQKRKERGISFVSSFPGS